MSQSAFSCSPTGIRSMPVEILSLIFIAGAGLDNLYVDSPFLLKTDQEYKPVPPSNFQDVVSHVCHHWRQVALNTQSLWTTLHFRHPSHISRARTYLTRCLLYATHLLDILVETVSKDDYVHGITLYSKELRDIFTLIIPHIKRWRAFHLKISDNECKGVARLFLSTCGSAPMLETLQLYHFENYRNSHGLYLATHRPPVTIFGNSLPRMENISLIGVNLQWDTSPFLSKLKNLELALHSENVRPSYKCWAQMLRSCPGLQTLCLHYSGPKQATGDPKLDWPSIEGKIRLQNLVNLILTDLDPTFLCDVVKRLSFPNLRKLSLDLPDQDYSPFIELVTNTRPNDQQSSGSNDLEPRNLVPKSMALLHNLQVLVVHALECSLESWMAFLNAASGLRKLEVDFARVGHRFWTAFTADGASKVLSLQRTRNPLLLPLLEEFKFTGVTGKDILSSLNYRYSCRKLQQYRAPREKWIVGWSERRRNRDVDLDNLITTGYWIPCRDIPEAKILIGNYYDDEEVEEDDDDDDGDSYED